MSTILLENYKTTLNIDIERVIVPTNNYNDMYIDIAQPNTQPRNMTLSPIQKYIDNENRFVNLTNDELNAIVYHNNVITFITCTHNSNDIHTTEYEKTYNTSELMLSGVTVQHMFDIILDFEKETRPLTSIMNGIDIHHIYFEGLQPITNTKYKPLWTS